MKLEFFLGGGMLLNGDPGGFVFFEADCQETGLKFSLGDVTSIETGLVILSFLCNYDNLTLKLHQEKRSYPNERWLFHWQIQSWKCARKEYCPYVRSKKV